MANSDIVTPTIEVNPRELLEKIGVDVKLNKSDLLDIMESDIQEQFEEKKLEAYTQINTFCEEKSKLFIKAEKKLEKCKEVTQLLKSVDSLSAATPVLKVALCVKSDRYNGYDYRNKDIPEIHWGLFSTAKTDVLRNVDDMFHNRNMLIARLTDYRPDLETCSNPPHTFEEAVPVSSVQWGRHDVVLSSSIDLAVAKKIGLPNVYDVFKEWQALRKAYTEYTRQLNDLPKLAKKGRVAFLRNILNGTPEGKQLGDLLGTATGATILKQMRA